MGKKIKKQKFVNENYKVNDSVVILKDINVGRGMVISAGTKVKVVGIIQDFMRPKGIEGDYEVKTSQGYKFTVWDNELYQVGHGLGESKINENINIELNRGYRIKSGNTTATFFVDGIDGDTVHATLGNGKHKDLSLAKLYLTNLSVMESKKVDPFLTVEEIMDIDRTFAASMVRKGMKKVRSSIVEQTITALYEGIETGEEFKHKGRKWKVMETQRDEQGTITMKLKRASKVNEAGVIVGNKVIVKKGAGAPNPEWFGESGIVKTIDGDNIEVELSVSGEIIWLPREEIVIESKSFKDLKQADVLDEDQDKWGFDYTEISASNWKTILSIAGASGSPVLRGSGERGGWVWQGHGVKIITSNDPFTGERYDTDEHPGMYDISKDFVGYIGIEGEAEKVKEIAKEIKKRASEIKGISPHDREFI